MFTELIRLGLTIGLKLGDPRDAEKEEKCDGDETGDDFIGVV